MAGGRTLAGLSSYAKTRRFWSSLDRMFPHAKVPLADTIVLATSVGLS